MDESVTGFVDALHAIKDPIKSFKKNTYEEQFRKFEREQKDCFDSLEQKFLSCGNDMAEQVKQTAEEITKKVADELNALAKKRFRVSRLSDYNMILAWKEQFPETDLKPATFAGINAGFKQRYCYITTAVCRSLGKPDECYELNLLRDYRDDYLSKQENGAELIRRYYDIAPTIVKRINRRQDSTAVYWDIWQTYLKPCIAYIEQGKKKECMKLYTNMVYDLQEKYFV